MLQTDCAYKKQYPGEETVHGRNRLSRDFAAATLSVEYTRDIPLHSWLISKISSNQLTSSTFSASRKAQEIFLFHLLIFFSLRTRK